MVQIIEQALPFGKLAENFGRSLGETIGEEAGRQQTARGIQALSQQLQQSSQPVSQLDLLGALSRIPGMTPDKLQLYLPALQDALKMRALRGAAGAEIGQQPAMGAEQPISVGARPGQKMAGQPEVTERVKGTLLTPEDTTALTEQIKVYTPQDIQSEALRLQQSGQFYSPTFEGFIEEATNRLEAGNTSLRARKDNAAAKQALEEKIRTDFQNQLDNRLQNQNLADSWQSIPGNIQKKMSDDVIDKVASGVPPAKAVEDTSKRALSFVREIGDFADLPGRPFLGKGQEAAQELQRYQKFFSEWDALPEYQSMLQQKGFGEHMAASIAYPASTDVRKELAKLQPRAKMSAKLHEIAPVNLPGIGLAKSTTSFLEKLLDWPKKTEETTKWSEKVADKIQPGDSLLTIAAGLSDAGYDDQAFYDVIESKAAEGLKLTDKQEQELARRAPVEPTMEDIWTALMGRTGKNNGKYGIWETIVRKFGGKR